MKCTGCIILSRVEQELKALLPNVDNQEDYQNLFSLVYKQGCYWMYHSKSLQDDTFKNHADRVWRIVKYEQFTTGKQNTYKVVQGDTIKFGRVRFQIKKLVVDKSDIDLNAEQNDITNIPQKINPANIDHSLTNNNLRLLTTENEGNNGTEPDTRMTQNFHKETVGFDNRPVSFEAGFLKQNEQDIKLKQVIINHQNSMTKSIDAINCKICLSEEDAQNPMISPCNCTGSMKYIHFECLREWLEGKKHMKETPYVNSYIWKNLECEICKSSYNDMITLKDGRVMSLLKYNVHEDAHSYMIIESVTNTTSKTIHVINFNAKKKVRVGRGQNAEVRITDISVSRFHTLIKLNKRGDVIIQDNQSKFGTLVQLTEPLQVGLNQPIYIQIGRTVTVIFAINRFSCLQRCFCALQKSKRTEQCLHYDEVAKYFPSEFQLMFDSIRNMKGRANSSMKQMLLNEGQTAHVRNQSQQQPIASMDASQLSNIDPPGRRFDYEQEEANDQDVAITSQQRLHDIRASQHATQQIREDRQISVAIEFVTQPERVDSENRQQIVNNLVQQMNNQRGLREGAVRVNSTAQIPNMLLQSSEHNHSQNAIPPIQFQGVMSGSQNINNLDVLNEDSEEDKDNPNESQESQRANGYTSRNPLSYLNSQRNHFDEEQQLKSMREDNENLVNRMMIQDPNDLISQYHATKKRGHMPSVKSETGFPKLQLMSPQHTNREPSVFSLSRYQDADEEEQRRIEMIQDSYEEVKIQQIDQLNIHDMDNNVQIINQSANANISHPTKQKTTSLYNNFDRGLRMAQVRDQKAVPIQNQNSSVLTTIQMTETQNPNNPTTMNYTQNQQDSFINESALNNKGAKQIKGRKRFNNQKSQ